MWYNRYKAKRNRNKKTQKKVRKEKRKKRRRKKEKRGKRTKKETTEKKEEKEKETKKGEKTEIKQDVLDWVWLTPMYSQTDAQALKAHLILSIPFLGCAWSIEQLLRPFSSQQALLHRDAPGERLFQFLEGDAEGAFASCATFECHFVAIEFSHGVSQNLVVHHGGLVS